MEPFEAVPRALTRRLSAHDVESWAEAEWTAFALWAREQGVAPLAYRELSRLPAELPAPAVRLLRREHYNTAGGNVLLYQQLEKILHAVADGAGDEPTVIVLKGADLASTLYPTIALRPMGDIDLLVKRDGVGAARRGLGEIGFREAAPEMSPGLGDEIGHGALLTAGPRSVGVDLHWSLVAGRRDRRTPPLDWFWSEALEHVHDGVGGGRPFRFHRLSPTAHLLYLAAHLVLQHGEDDERLIWLYDIHLLAGRGDVRWDDAIEKAEELGWTGALWKALEKSRDRLGTTLPEGLERLRAGKSALVAPIGAGSGKAARFARQWRNLTGRGRARLLAGLMFPSPAYLRARYRPRPAWLWPLWYPVRWASMAGELLRALVR